MDLKEIASHQKNYKTIQQEKAKQREEKIEQFQEEWRERRPKYQVGVAVEEDLRCRDELEAKELQKHKYHEIMNDYAKNVKEMYWDGAQTERKPMSEKTKVQRQSMPKMPRRGNELPDIYGGKSGAETPRARKKIVWKSEFTKQQEQDKMKAEVKGRELDERGQRDLFKEKNN